LEHRLAGGGEEKDVGRILLFESKRFADAEIGKGFVIRAVDKFEHHSAGNGKCIDQFRFTRAGFTCQFMKSA